MKQVKNPNLKGRRPVPKRALFKFKNWRIRRYDRHNLVVEQYREKKGKDTNGEMKWSFVGYKGKLEDALVFLGDRIGMQSDTLNEAISEIRELRMLAGKLIK